MHVLTRWYTRHGGQGRVVLSVDCWEADRRDYDLMLTVLKFPPILEGHAISYFRIRRRQEWIANLEKMWPPYPYEPL